MPRQASQQQGTRRLAAGGVAAIMAALAIPSLPATAATAGRGSSAAGRPAAAAGAGTLRAWGRNSSGQLGNGTRAKVKVPVKVQLPPGTRITSVRAGCAFSVALTSNGQLLAWGDNSGGQLGDGGVVASSTTPVKVQLPAGTRITSVRAGCAHVLALTSTGQVLAWGDNELGQLGDGLAGNGFTPVAVQLPGGAKVRAISAGLAHSLALTTGGQVFAWGFNNSGQLGDGTEADSAIPVLVNLPPGVSVTGVAAGQVHSLALTSKGQVLAWGFNREGELGDGTAISSTTPVRTRLPRGSRVRGLFAGCTHTLALTAAGQVLAWGDNAFGQLGRGRPGHSDVPVRVRLPRGVKVTAISAGCLHSLALTSKGAVLAWGNDEFGQLGDGLTISRAAPVRVKLPAGLTAIAIGSGPDALFSLAIVRTARP